MIELLYFYDIGHHMMVLMMVRRNNTDVGTDQVERIVSLTQIQIPLPGFPLNDSAQTLIFLGTFPLTLVYFGDIWFSPFQSYLLSSCLLF